MSQWFETGGCRNGSACSPCRNSTEFRQSVVDAGLIEERDFECPWGGDPPRIGEGPGTKLARWLKRLGFRQSKTCACRSMIVRMNSGGPKWCIENVEEIVWALREASDDPEANPRGIPFIAMVARKMVLHACR